MHAGICYVAHSKDVAICVILQLEGWFDANEAVGLIDQTFWIRCWEGVYELIVGLLSGCWNDEFCFNLLAIAEMDSKWLSIFGEAALRYCRTGSSNEPMGMSIGGRSGFVVYSLYALLIERVLEHFMEVTMELMHQCVSRVNESHFFLWV